MKKNSTKSLSVAGLDVDDQKEKQTQSIAENVLSDGQKAVLGIITQHVVSKTSWETFSWNCSSYCCNDSNDRQSSLKSNWKSIRKCATELQNTAIFIAKQPHSLCFFWIHQWLHVVFFYTIVMEKKHTSDAFKGACDATDQAMKAVDMDSLLCKL